MSTDKFDLVLARADRVMRQIDERDGSVKSAAQRERARLNSGLGRTLKRVAIAVAAICVATIGIGLILPIGMFGFLAAIGLAIAIAAVLVFSGTREIAAIKVAPDLPNGEMVQRFDSYIFRTRRALPAPAQAEIDLLSQRLVPLKETLSRVEQNDPDAQDARRLMSTHLPGLIDRYLHVPSSYRTEYDAEGKSVDDRLVDALAAGRTALDDISAKLARNDLAAFETQGRFIEARYKDESLG
ncbi:MAG: hypothetical protein M3R03_08420 [Pseudomonadota bacterium]|nr:hypothetical protein [Pseudomonadota bacterium]